MMGVCVGGQHPRRQVWVAKEALLVPSLFAGSPLGLMSSRDTGDPWSAVSRRGQGRLCQDENRHSPEMRRAQHSGWVGEGGVWSSKVDVLSLLSSERQNGVERGVRRVSGPVVRTDL